MLKVTPREDTPTTRSVISAVWSKVDPGGFDYAKLLHAVINKAPLLIVGAVTVSGEQRLQEVADTERMPVAPTTKSPTGRPRCGTCLHCVPLKGGLGNCRRPVPPDLYIGLEHPYSLGRVDLEIDYCNHHHERT